MLSDTEFIFGFAYNNRKERFDLKIWKLGIDTGKRDDSQQYQLVNRDKMFLSDFEKKINMAEKQNGMLDDLQVHVIHGRKESDMTYLWNGSGFTLSMRGQK